MTPYSNYKEVSEPEVPEILTKTPFSEVFEIFLSLITDDLYSIFDEKETEEDLCILLKQAIPRFEFPKDVIELDSINKSFTRILTIEEINIIGNIMAELWLGRKIKDQRIINMEYGDKDFSMKSQGSHLKVLNDTLKDLKIETHYMQKLYNRRTKTGTPNYSGIAGSK